MNLSQIPVGDYSKRDLPILFFFFFLTFKVAFGEANGMVLLQSPAGLCFETEKVSCPVFFREKSRNLRILLDGVDSSPFSVVPSSEQKRATTVGRHTHTHTHPDAARGEWDEGSRLPWYGSF